MFFGGGRSAGLYERTAGLYLDLPPFVLSLSKHLAPR